MRSIWSGAINFGLINIPVKLYSATEQKDLKLHFLHKKDQSPIRFAKICRHDGKEIDYKDIVRGYEYRKGDYLVLSEEDFAKADINKDHVIEITNFVETKEIDPIFFIKPYYLEPAKGGEKAYAVLREALKQSDKVAVVQFVIRNREHLGILKPENNIIVLEEMRFEEEIREPKNLDLPDAKSVKKEEINMAKKLIDQLSSDFDITQYKDQYQENLEKIIAEKAQGKKPSSKGKKIKTTQVPDLLKALKESLAREQQSVKR